MIWLYLYFSQIAICYPMLMLFFYFNNPPNWGKRKRLVWAFQNSFLSFIPVIGLFILFVCIVMLIKEICIGINNKLERWADNDPNLPKNIIKKAEKIIEEEAPIIEEPISPLDINLD